MLITHVVFMFAFPSSNIFVFMVSSLNALHPLGKRAVTIMRRPQPSGPPVGVVTQHFNPPPKLTGCLPNLTNLEIEGMIGVAQLWLFQSKVDSVNLLRDKRVKG